MSTVDRRLARWVYASFAKHLTDCLSEHFPISIDFLLCADQRWHDAHSKAQASFVGPHVVENRLITVGVSVKLTSNRGKNDYEHIDRAGRIQNCLDRCLLILDHSDVVGTQEIATIRTTEEIRVLHIEPEQTDQQLHSIVTASYSGDI